MKKVYLLLIISAIIFPLFSQSNYYYQERAAQIREEVWSWDIPSFKNYSVPDELKNESAIILAKHRQIDATAQKSNIFKQTGKLFYTDTDRRMIKINDQTSLDRYSDFSFKEVEEKKFGVYSTISNVVVTVLGARIIKPDGSIKEVNVSKLAVTVTEGKDDKAAYKKLAIPELQINDILDVFICEIYELETFNIREQNISFYSEDNPTLHFSCSLTFGKNLTIEYRSINGAPKFVQETDKNGNIVLTAQSDNIMRIKDFDNIKWLSPYNDLPMIRFVVLQNASKIFYKPPSARPIGVHENVSYTTINNDALYFLAYNNSKLSVIKETEKKVKEIVNNYKKADSGISNENLANIIYTALNFEWHEGFPQYYNSETFTLTLINLLREYNIDAKVGLVTYKYGPRKKEIVTADDVACMVIANQSTQYFFSPYRYRVPGEIPAGFQGETASTFSYTNISVSSYSNSTSVSIDGSWGEPVILPETSANLNANKTQLNVSFNHDDMRKIDIVRNSIWSGNLKNDIQPYLLLYEEWDKELRSFLKIDKSYIEELKEKKNTRQYASQTEGNFEKSRNKYSETIENEIKSYHGFTSDNVKSYSFSSLGVTFEKPQLEYEISYTMNDFVRNAGENIILDVGKLIGKQWNPNENERNRVVNAYLPARRLFEYEIFVQIPDEYTVGDIEHLNMDFSNEYAGFEVVAGIENNTVKIQTRKVYNQDYISQKKWHELIEVIDKSNEFYASSIILQKKIE